MAAPLIFSGLGELLSERAGVLNLGVEGMMEVGLFCAFISTLYTGNPLVGLLMGLVSGGLMGLIHAFLCVTAKANQAIAGLSLFLLGPSLTSFLNQSFFGGISNSIKGFSNFKINLNTFFGPFMIDFNMLILFSFLFPVIAGLILSKTTYGLKIRAVGEYPRAADTMGINVYKVRYLCTTLGGALAGLGGASLILMMPNQRYFEGMVAGRGWISIALVIFAKWNPNILIAGAILFGAAEALQLQFQIIGIPIPSQILIMFPFVITLIALIPISKGVNRPASLGAPYKRV